MKNLRTFFTNRKLSSFITLLIVLFLLDASRVCGQINTWQDFVGTGVPGVSKGPLGYFYFDGNDTLFQPGYQNGDIQFNSLVSFGSNVSINVDDLIDNGFLMPLVIPSGVTLAGDFDLLNNPGGTLIFSNKHRNQYCLDHDSIQYMFIFSLAPACTLSGTCNTVTSIRNINLRGPNLGSTDFNIGYNTNPASKLDEQYCGGIIVPHPSFIGNNSICSGCFGYGYQISNCEIGGFNQAGIFVDVHTDEITIDHCFIHHINPNGVKGSGYEIYSDMQIEVYSDIKDNITISNCLFDEGKNTYDATAHGPFNVYYHDNSQTQTSGGINRHNNSPTYYPYATHSNCQFFHERYGCYESECIYTAADVPFGIDDCSPGNYKIQNSIFNTGALSIPFPGKFGYKWNITWPGSTFDNYPGLRPVNTATEHVLWDGSTYNMAFGYVQDQNNDDCGWNVSSAFQNAFSTSPFQFLGTEVTECYVSSNGFIQFDNNPTKIVNKVPSYFPYEINSNTNGIIALCLTDLEPAYTTQCSIKCWTDIDAFVIQYENIHLKNDPSYVTGQIVLYTNNAIEIILDHQDLPTDTTELQRFLGIVGPTGNSGSVPVSLLKGWKNSFSSRNIKIADPHKNTNDCILFPEDCPCNIDINNWNIISPQSFYFEPPRQYDVHVIENTCKSLEVDPQGCADNLRTGYAQISNNYIGSCTWHGDGKIIATDNTTGYTPGTEVLPNCPQPPEQNLDLTDGNASLPTTTNLSITPGHTRMQYIDAGAAFEVHITPGSLGSQNAAYIVRPNPSLGALVQGSALNTESCNNHFFNDEVIVHGNPNATAQFAYPDPGLHGLDVLAIDAQGSFGGEKYYSSEWQHIPVIVQSQEYNLIFNIRDSYQEFHHFTAYGCGSCETGVRKQVELNGNPIWQEDISRGGDGWERVAIDLSQPNPIGTMSPVMLTYLYTDGRPNVLTFSIALDPNAAVETDKVKGVVVWVDDVYLKSFNMPENLIADGDIERTEISTSLPIATSSMWYRNNPYTFSCAVTQCDAEVSGSVRKSGLHALTLLLPLVNHSICPTYDYPTSTNGIAISAATKVDFRGLLGCHNYGLSFPSSQLVGTGIQFGPSTDATLTYRLTSDLIIGDGSTSTDVEFNGCAVAIDPSVSITITNGASLTIQQDANGSYSNLFACSDMWQGIVVEPGGSLTIRDGSTVSDAITAISCVGDGTSNVPNLRLNNFNDEENIFDHNGVSVELYNADYSGFYCFPNNFLCTGGMISKEPMRGMTSYAHMILRSAENILVGDSYNSNNPANYFEDAAFGIMALNSDLTAIHNNFKNIDAQDQDFEPSAIYLNSDATVTFIAGDMLQNTNANMYKNTFTNCQKGITCLGDVLTGIYKNDFTNNILDILLSFNYTQTIDVLENVSEDSYSSILLFDNYTTEKITLKKNYIQGRMDNLGIPASSHGIGFYEPYNVSLNLEINENEVTNMPLGIRIINVDKIRNGLFDVSQNIIQYLPDESKVGGLSYRGIYLSNCSGANIGSNQITWDNNFVFPGDELLIHAYETQVQGIRLENVRTSDVKDNTVTTCGTGMFLQNNCSGTYLTCNSLVDNYPGIFLDNITLPNQVGSCEASKNTWTGNYTSTLQRIDGYGTALTWYYTGVGNPTNNTYPAPSPGLLIIPSSLSCASTSSCDGGSGGELLSDDTDNKNEELDEQVDNPESFTYFPDENEYMRNEYSYKILADDNTLINTIEREAFITENEESNFAKLQEAEVLINDGEIAAAIAKSIEVDDPNTFEQNKKTIHSIFLSGSEIRDSLSPADSLIVFQLAHERAVDAGEAVYWARGKLGLHIEDDNTSNLRLKKESNSISPTNYSVRAYPNPAKNEISIESMTEDVNLKKLTILNSYLQEVAVLSAKNQFQVIDVSNLQQGIYFLKVDLSNDNSKLLRITLIR